MRNNIIASFIFVPLFLFFSFLYYLQLAVHNMDPDKALSDYWTAFKHTWYMSTSFWAAILILFLYIWLVLFYKPKVE